MDMSNKVILVAGATGHQGGAVARSLIDAGWKVRILTRDLNKPAVQELVNLGAQAVQGDFENLPTLQEAFKGCYGAFSVQDYYQAGADGEVRQGKNFARMAKDAGVKHFVYSSVGSANRNTGVPHFVTKWHIEQYIRELELPATIVRPVFFMDNFWTYQKDQILNGTLSFPLPPDRKLQMIAVDDIGRVVAVCFQKVDKYIAQSFDLAGDELTIPQAARYIGDTVGREVRYVQQSLEPVRQQMPELAKMYEWFAEVGYNADLTFCRTLCPLLDFRGYLRTSHWARLHVGAVSR